MPPITAAAGPDGVRDPTRTNDNELRADPVRRCSSSPARSALADRLVFARQRAAGAPEPWWIEYPKSFFPVMLIVFLLRSFLVEPFKIPSASMLPTLLVGDFILVNKFTYGIRLPIIEQEDHRARPTRSAATSWCSATR